MAGKRYTAEQIIIKLREAEVGLGVHSHDVLHKGKSADRRQTTQALMLAVMIIEVKPGAKPANTVA